MRNSTAPRSWCQENNQKRRDQREAAVDAYPDHQRLPQTPLRFALSYFPLYQVVLHVGKVLDREVDEHSSKTGHNTYQKHDQPPGHLLVSYIRASVVFIILFQVNQIVRLLIVQALSLIAYKTFIVL